MNGTVVQIRDGAVALPAKLRARYKLAEGDTLTLLDLDGVFILASQESQVQRLGVVLEQKRKAAGLSIADLLDGLDEQRRIYSQEKYGITSSTFSDSQSLYRRRRPRRGRVLHDRG